MYGYLLKLGLTAKQAELFMYYLSIMVHSEEVEDPTLEAFKYALKQVYNFER